MERFNYTMWSFLIARIAYKLELEVAFATETGLLEERLMS